MTEILNEYDSITLDEMRSIRLMNRIDTKFVTTVPMLRQLLLLAKDDYFVTSERLRTSIADAQILTDVYGSDHCPVVLELNL